jgi:hypothetical protein
MGNLPSSGLAPDKHRQLRLHDTEATAASLFACVRIASSVRAKRRAAAPPGASVCEFEL